MSSSVYLDYAATAAIRPPQIAEAVVEFVRNVGATPGRSGHQLALEAGRTALRCRRLLAELFGIEGDPGRIAFQLNATHALNTAILGVLEPGDRVVRTQYDHNAVRRPVAAMVRSGVRESIIEFDRQGHFELVQVERLLSGDGSPARLLVVPHASNVTGVVLPVRTLAELAHDVGALVLVDIAQTAGHFPVNVVEMGADMVAFTGHKGLLGPQGIGGLWVRDGVPVKPLLSGGTGGDSLPLIMPDSYPDHLEAGTQNAPGIAGLAAGVEWLLARGISAVWDTESLLKRRLLEGLATVPGVRVCSPETAEGVGIVTLVYEGVDPGQLATLVERSHGIQGRSGLHCAPEAHAAMGTLETGAFRLSLGWASTPEDVDAAIAALRAAPTTRVAQ